MAVRYVSLPAVNKRVPLGQYVGAILLAKANPDVEFRHGLTTWWPQTGAQIMRQFREGLHDRINQAVPAERRGVDRPVDIRPDVRPVHAPGAAVTAGRVHRNQAQWRRRLTGKRHLWESWLHEGDDEPYYVCERCERKHGVGADDPNYLGPGGHIPLQHLGRDARGNAIIPWCDHPEHPRAARPAAA